jgi:hypothetical protein
MCQKNMTLRQLLNCDRTEPENSAWTSKKDKP